MISFARRYQNRIAGQFFYGRRMRDVGNTREKRGGDEEQRFEKILHIVCKLYSFYREKQRKFYEFCILRVPELRKNNKKTKNTEKIKGNNCIPYCIFINFVYHRIAYIMHKCVLIRKKLFLFLLIQVIFV